MASESSSTECTDCGHTHKRNTHTCGWKFTDTYSCECKGPRPVPLATPCECGHTRNFHLDGRRMFPCIVGRCACGNFKVKPREEQPKVCVCGPDEGCGDPCDYEARLTPQEPETVLFERYEPPMTPEEEEELAPEPSCCGNPKCTCTGSCNCDQVSEDEPGPDHVCETYYCPTAGEVESACHGGFDVCCGAPEKHAPADKAPRQPERRPPYAVDYSAGGHPFQVLVPGDAAVLAVDGALIIRHADFPVLGISCITPLKTEAS